MQQRAGFENRFIDKYLFDPEHLSDCSHYAPVFKPTDATSLTVFPGTKAVPFSSETSKENELLSASIILPTALLLAVLLFVFLKNTLKSSVGSLFLVGLSPKLLQETERRQIERNTLIIGAINRVSFFSMALIIYAFVIRFEFLITPYELFNIPEKYFYLTIFAFAVAIVFLFFAARSTFIEFFGVIFDAEKILKGYQKPYKLLGVSMSPVLLLMALFTAYAPFSLMDSVSFYILACIAACYVIFIVISLSKFLNFINRYTVHIFLYLCTLEILPLLVMAKFMQSVCF